MAFVMLAHANLYPREFESVSGNWAIKIDQFKRCDGALLIF